MEYFKYTKKEIKKYIVSFNKKEIGEFRKKVIDECSEIEHLEYDGTERPRYCDYEKVRNYSEYVIGVKESHDLYTPDMTIYHFSYNKYNYPYLVNIIDKLLLGDVSSLDDIFNPNYKLERKSVASRLKNASNNLNNMNKFDIEEKKLKLAELQKLVELSKLNENQKNIKEYYLKLQSMITLTLIDTLTISEYDRVNNFFNNTNFIKKKLFKK